MLDIGGVLLSCHVLHPLRLSGVCAALGVLGSLLLRLLGHLLLCLTLAGGVLWSRSICLRRLEVVSVIHTVGVGLRLVLRHFDGSSDSRWIWLMFCDCELLYRNGFVVVEFQIARSGIGVL